MEEDKYAEDDTIEIEKEFEIIFDESESLHKLGFIFGRLDEKKQHKQTLKKKRQDSDTFNVLQMNLDFYNSGLRKGIEVINSFIDIINSPRALNSLNQTGKMTTELLASDKGRKNLGNLSNTLRRTQKGLLEVNPFASDYLLTNGNLISG